ncbi:MAG: outer membrane protein transport protein [Gammaproteobacteria bacterium]|nr:outer membrane protein transport protein [Gammaproteobacteria bacterium]
MKKLLKTSSMAKVTIATVLTVCAANSFAINGVFDYGLGQINRGMGGAGVAKPQDAYAAVINPAGLGAINHNWDAGVAAYFPMMYSKWGVGASAFPFSPLAAPAGKYESEQRIFILPDAAYVYHYNRKNHFGLSLNAVGGFGSRYTTDKHATVFGAPVPRRGVLGDGTIIASLQIASLNASYNYWIMPNLSFGLTLSYYIQAFKSAGSQGLAPFTETFLTTGAAPTKLSNNGTDYNHGVSGTLGGLYRFNKHFAIGASGTPRVYMTKMHEYKDLLVNHGELDIPAKYTVGVNISPTDKLDFVVDLVKIMNKDIDIYGNNSRALFDGRCAPGSPIANPVSCIGGKNGPGFGWSNQTLLKVGGSYKLNPKDTVRLGVSYGNRIGHAGDIIINTFAPGSAAKWVTSAGYSRRMSWYTLNTFLTFIPNQSLSGVNELSVGAAQTLKLKVGGVGFGVGMSV